MATISSSDDSIAPKDYHLSSSTDSSRLGITRQKCPLCHNFRKVFYCKDCIYNGLFYSSRQHATEGYIDKQRALLELQDTNETIEKNCFGVLEARRRLYDLNSKIRQTRERNKLLKSAIESKKQKKIIDQANFLELKDKNEKRNKSLPKYDSKVQEIENYVAARREKVEKTRETWSEKQEELKKLVKIRIYQLFKYIFPIYKVKPSIETESSSDDMISALAEASQTTFMSDKWEYSDYMGEVKYSIVGPTLPGSGNYSAYNIWVAQNQDGVPGSNTTGSVEQNPAFNINAALTYTAQLVNILSYYFNIKLPHKLQYSDFCNGYMTEQQFARRTARLNANILYLCLMQKVELCNLQSSETIHNILQLLEDENCDLGREGPLEFDVRKVHALEQPLAENLKINEDSDSEESDSFPVEWEAVPHVQCPEIAAGPAISQAPQMIMTQQASSMAGGLVNSAAASIASIWRGFTGR